MMIEEVGVPSLVLMENAGRSASQWMLSRAEVLGLSSGGTAGVLCGGGNNGGDGYVLARHLVAAGVPAFLIELGDPLRLSSDAAVNRRICAQLGIPMGTWPLSGAEIGSISCWVDAVLGAGFKPPLRIEERTVLDEIGSLAMAAGARVVALDSPSGLDMDSGVAAPGALRADFTLTFGAQKAGFLAPGAADWTGDVFVISLGAPIPPKGA